VHDNLAPAGAQGALPIWCVSDIEALPGAARAWAQATGFEPASGKHLLVPDASGGIAGAVLGTRPVRGHRDPFAAGTLPAVLPAGTWRLEGLADGARLAALGFLLGAYRFSRYTGAAAWPARLVVPDGVDADWLVRTATATALGRDLVNTPTNDLGPAELEAAIRAVGTECGAEVRSIVGDDLLGENFPMIHAVGRASTSAPRLVDLSWGDAGAPKVTLVGKGVCFDTGGLDIKPEAAMLLMKKDMGGAASALAAARMIMQAKLPVRLRLLVPAVENSIAGDAFRPGDILRSRKGLSVQIGNTDAEGRLVLADALALADEEAPELLVDFATLTGAARVALGPDLPPLYTDDDGLAADLMAYGMAENDPLWRMPLWTPYEATLDSRIASLNNVGTGGMAGSITAALFLRRFVERAAAWAHMDIYAWNPAARPGRPDGGEVQGARALVAMLTHRFG
jgi:leucyl aminopeptidase